MDDHRKILVWVDWRQWIVGFEVGIASVSIYVGPVGVLIRTL